MSDVLAYSRYDLDLSHHVGAGCYYIKFRPLPYIYLKVKITHMSLKDLAKYVPNLSINLLKKLYIKFLSLWI